MLRELRSPSLRGFFEAVGGTIPEDDLLADMHVDFCQLFLGPTDHLPPFQSVWESGQFCGNAAVSMNQFIDMVGYETDGTPVGVASDHLAVQFHVKARVLEQLASRGPGDEPLIAELAHHYFEAHLRWPKDFLGMAERQAKTDFYRCLCVMTREFLELESHEYIDPNPT
jgi:TorA maturation chaperone TorD